MSTSNSFPTLEAALVKIPAQFRKRIITSYLEIKKRFGEAVFDASFDSAGLSSGKFVEGVFRFLQHSLTGSHISFGKPIPNFPDEARKLIRLPQSTGVESLRVIIPRALVFLYTLRGKRGIGHVGGDIEANEIDSATIVRLSDWIICELIRIFHGLSLEEAQGLVDALSSRNLPDVWEIGNKKRILRKGFDYKQQVLLFAYTDIQGGVLVEDLFEWTEYSSLSVFRKSVLKSLHTKRLIEYDQDLECVLLSPSGVQEVEEKLLERPYRTPVATASKGRKQKRKTRKKQSGTHA